MVGAKVSSEGTGVGGGRYSTDGHNDVAYSGKRRGSRDNDDAHGNKRRGSRDNDGDHHHGDHHHGGKVKPDYGDAKPKKPSFIKQLSGSFRLGHGRRASATQGIVGNTGISDKHDHHHHHEEDNHGKKGKGNGKGKATAHGHDRLPPPEGYDRRYSKVKDANEDSEDSIRKHEARGGKHMGMGGKKKKPGFVRQMSEKGKSKFGKLKKSLSFKQSSEKATGNYATNQSYSAEERNRQHKSTAGAMVITVAIVVGAMVFFL